MVFFSPLVCHFHFSAFIHVTQTAFWTNTLWLYMYTAPSTTICSRCKRRKLQIVARENFSSIQFEPFWLIDLNVVIAKFIYLNRISSCLSYFEEWLRDMGVMSCLHTTETGSHGWVKFPRHSDPGAEPRVTLATHWILSCKVTVPMVR